MNHQLGFYPRQVVDMPKLREAVSNQSSLYVIEAVCEVKTQLVKLYCI